jgi:hypothetical protein
VPGSGTLATPRRGNLCEDRDVSDKEASADRADNPFVPAGRGLPEGYAHPHASEQARRIAEAVSSPN